MKKRSIALLLVMALVLGMLPMVASAKETQAAPEIIEEDAYVQVDALFDEIGKLEDVHATRNTSQSQITDDAQELVMASDAYVEGSLERNGDAFTWWTEDGIRCAYSPRLREIHENMTPTEGGGDDGTYNEPVTTKGGWPSGNQVYLIGPYYGYDSEFTDQYKNEAKRIAAAIGDTDGYTLYSGRNATVDNVATAMSQGAVVIFDSHGTTNYESGYDYVTGATSSYLCLTSTTGLTSADYDDGALYYSDGICINGATIANHMKSNSPSGILWMAICLGMATDTMCAPLREKGVEVVCGYSQSVTFAGDYLFEDAFWDKVCAGETVATASKYMKDTWGNWDWSTKIARYYGYSDGYSSITSARADYAAFPVVVSDEDTHPGQRNKNIFYGADSLQTVKSTYTLFSQYTVTARSNNTAYGTVSVNGSTITATPKTGYTAQGYTVVSGSATVTQNGNTFSVQASSDCTIQINFVPKQQVTVSFSGADVAPITGYSGDTVTLPKATAPEGYTFEGWVKNSLSEDTSTKPSVLTTFTPTANTTLYALYSYVEESSDTGSGDYVKVTSTPSDWEGQYVIVYEGSKYIFDGSLTSFDKTSNYKAVTITNNTISAAQGDDYSFTIEAYSGGYAIKGTSGKYIGNSSNSNALTTGSSAMKNTLAIAADGTATIKSSGGSYLRFNNNSGQYRFRYYKSSSYTSQKAICLYKKDGSSATTWYTTQIAACDHSAVTEGVCEGCGLQFAALAGGRYHLTVQDAINSTTGIIKLMTDCDESVTADTLYMDLNGHLLSQVTVTQGLFCYDNTATVNKAGNGGILAVNGPVAPDFSAGNNRYIALECDGSYTFHVLEMTVDTVTLRTGEAGIYYGASIRCDDQLKASIAAHGIALSTVDMPGNDYDEAHNLYIRNNGAPYGEFTSVVVSGIFKEGAADNARRGQLPIYANIYLVLENGSVILGDNTTADTTEAAGFDGAAMSLADMLTYFSNNLTAFPPQSQTILNSFFTKWKAELSALGIR